MSYIHGTDGARADQVLLNNAQGKESRLEQPGTVIRVKVQPKASRNQILGFRGDALQVRVATPPERGKANEALVELLAAALGIARSKVRILKGHTSRDKLIAIDGLSPEDLHPRLRSEQPK